jgi:hypothetical protein
MQKELKGLAANKKNSLRFTNPKNRRGESLSSPNISFGSPVRAQGTFLFSVEFTPIITMWLGLTWDKKTAWV